MHNKMLQLSQLQGNTEQKLFGLASIGKYSILKIMLNKDYLAKNYLGQKYLLCQTTGKSEYHSQMLKGSHIIGSIQLISDQSHKYQVFPFQKKFTWLGDAASLKSKPQIYCLALLYSAVKLIVKPFLKLPKASQLLKCICLENIWFKSTSSFLFICNRNKDKSTSFKTEAKHRKIVDLFQVQRSAMSKMGQVFWQAFFGESKDKQVQSKSTFKELLRAIIKGEKSLAEFQDIMQDRLAKRRFVSTVNKKYTLQYNQPNQALVQSPNKNTIDENILSKLDNIPIKAGKPYYGLHFNRKKSINATPMNRRYSILNNLLDEDDTIPPSFANSKKKKRFSLFSGSKIPLRYTNQQAGRQSQTITLSLQRKNQLPNKYSLDVNSNIGRLRQYNQQKNKIKATQRKRQLRRFFQQVKPNSTKTQNSRFEVLNESSKQKALAIFKKSIVQDDQSLDNSIDDKLFVANLRVKRHQFKKNVQNSLIKACQFIGLKQSPTKDSIIKKETELPIKREETFQRDLTIKQQIIQKSYQIQHKNERSFYQAKEQVPKQGKIFNQNLLQIQKAVYSHLNPKQIIDFNVQSSIVKKPEQKVIKSYLQDDEQFFTDLREKSNVIQKKDSKKPSQQNKEANYLRDGSKVQLIPLIRNNNIQPAKPIQSQKQDQQLHDMINLSSLKSKAPNLKQAKQIPKQAPKSLPNLTNMPLLSKIGDQKQPEQASKQQTNTVKEAVKQNEIQQARGNFSFAAVKQEKSSEIQQIKSYVIDKKDKKQVLQQKPKVQKEVKAQKPIKKQPKSIKNIDAVLDDQIEEIALDSVKPKKNAVTSVQKIEQAKEQSSMLAKPQLSEINISCMQPPKVQKPTRKPSIQDPKQKNAQAQVSQKEEKQKSVKNQRLKTGQSNASSNGNSKPVKKQIDEYIHIINKMGEAVAKTSKLNKKLQRIEWFTGVYYLYKRFFYQRKKIQKYLQDQVPKLTRYSPFGDDQWNQWLKKGEREALLTKCQQDNANIEKSIKKMLKKLESQQLPATILLNAGLNKNMQDSSRIAVEYVVDEYDQLVENDLLKDPQLYAHICEMVNALYVMGQLDGKVKQKRPVLDFSNTKRSKQQLARMVQAIFDLYQQQ